MLGKSDAVGAREELAKLDAPVIEPIAPDVCSIDRQEIEGVQEHARVMGARAQPLEVGHAIVTAHHRLAVDEEPGHGEPARRVHYPRIALAPIEAAPRE